MHEPIPQSLHQGKGGTIINSLILQLKTLKLRQILAAKWWNKRVSPVITPESELLTMPGEGPRAGRWRRGCNQPGLSLRGCVLPFPTTVTATIFSHLEWRFSPSVRGITSPGAKIQPPTPALCEFRFIHCFWVHLMRPLGLIHF